MWSAREINMKTNVSIMWKDRGNYVAMTYIGNGKWVAFVL